MSARPTWDQYFLTITRQVAERSTCLRARVGAVIVRDKNILATGYNGSPAGLPHCPDPWRRLALPILVGRDLRAAFPGGETLSLAKPGPAIALVPARRDLPLRYARLRRNIQAAFGTQIRMTPLPGRLTEALRLVDELAR